MALVRRPDAFRETFEQPSEVTRHLDWRSAFTLIPEPNEGWTSLSGTLQSPHRSPAA